MFWASVSYVNKITLLSDIDKGPILQVSPVAFDLPAFPGNLSRPDFKMLEKIEFMHFIHLIN